MREKLIQLGFVNGKIDSKRFYYSNENGNTIAWNERTGTATIYEHGILRSEIANATIQQITNLLNAIQ